MKWRWAFYSLVIYSFYSEITHEMEMSILIQICYKSAWRRFMMLISISHIYKRVMAQIYDADLHFMISICAMTRLYMWDMTHEVELSNCIEILALTHRCERRDSQTERHDSHTDMRDVTPRLRDMTHTLIWETWLTDWYERHDSLMGETWLTHWETCLTR